MHPRTQQLSAHAPGRSAHSTARLAQHSTRANLPPPQHFSPPWREQETSELRSKHTASAFCTRCTPANSQRSSATRAPAQVQSAVPPVSLRSSKLGSRSSNIFAISKLLAPAAPPINLSMQGATGTLGAPRKRLQPRAKCACRSHAPCCARRLHTAASLKMDVAIAGEEGWSPST